MKQNCNSTIYMWWSIFSYSQLTNLNMETVVPNFQMMFPNYRDDVPKLLRWCFQITEMMFPNYCLPNQEQLTFITRNFIIFSAVKRGNTWFHGMPNTFKVHSSLNLGIIQPRTNVCIVLDSVMDIHSGIRKVSCSLVVLIVGTQVTSWFRSMPGGYCFFFQITSWMHIHVTMSRW